MLYWVFKAVLSPVIKVCLRVEIDGRHNVAKSGPVILASNHRSFIDSILIPYAVRRRRVTYVAKAEYFESRKTRWFFGGTGQIPIQRGDGSAAKRSLQTAKEVIDNGGIFAIYPEGTRSRDGLLHRGKTGAARLSIRSQVPIVPVGVIGTNKVMPIGSRFPKFAKTVKIAFGPPMYPPVRPADQREAAREFTDKLMDAIAELCDSEVAPD